MAGQLFAGSSRRDRLVARAQKAVHDAVKEGRMAAVTTKKCVDCGNPAECYEHRDYTRPLKVEPVCKRCNNLRGPGWPYPTEEDGNIHKHGVAGIGTRWTGMEGGEGFEPLSAQLIAAIDVDLLSEISADHLSGERYRISKLVNGALPDWQQRADYFKARDPWAA